MQSNKKNLAILWNIFAASFKQKCELSTFKSLCYSI